MDPHEVQPYVPNFVEDMNDLTYHTNTMWKLKFSQLDPSVALVNNFFSILEEKKFEAFEWFMKSINLSLKTFPGVCLQIGRGLFRLSRFPEKCN